MDADGRSWVMGEVSAVEVLGRFLWLVASYGVGLWLAVVWHELGHAIVALAVTRQSVVLQVGREAKVPGWRLGRLELRFSWRGTRYGFTRYERTAESRMRQTLVAVAGPLASLVGCVVFGWLMTRSLVGSWEWILWLGLCVSQFRVWVVAVWPVAYRPDGPEGEEWLSDSLDVWRMWRS